MKQDKDPEIQFIGKPTSNVSIGLVGLPNVGKSSLFNVLSGLSVPASNYSFCTIDPNKAKIHVPEAKLDFLKDTFRSTAVHPPLLSICDIAGLVSGASEGKGLGNEFLSHIAAVDAIYEVVRAFANPEVEHFEGDVNPVRDLRIIKEELIKKDLSTLKRKAADLEKKKRGSKAAELSTETATLEKAQRLLEEGKTILSNLLLNAADLSKARETGKVKPWEGKEVEVLRGWNLLTAKPIVYLVNVSLKDWVKGGNRFFKDVRQWIETEDLSRPGFRSKIVPFSAEFETELAKAPDKEGFLESLKKRYGKESVKGSRLDEIIDEGYKALSLIHFFTAGPKEVRAWTVRKGTKAKEAAGCIHGDLEKSFICAEVYSYEDLAECGSEGELKKRGLYRQEGKGYVVRDGDVILFRSGLGSKR